MATIDTARGQIINYLEGVKGEIIEQMIAKNMVASKRTIQSMQVIPSNTGAKLVAAEHIIFLEDGRGPTKPGATQGDDSLVDIIKDWINVKGLDLNPYAVAKKIHKEGTKLYRQGGNSGILSIPLAGAGLSDLYAEIATMYSQQVSSEIYEPINELQHA